MDNTGAFISSSIVIVFAALCLVFSQEVMRLLTKVSNKPLVMLLLALVLASWFVEEFEEWGRWLLLTCRVELENVFLKIAEFLPFGMSSLYLLRIAFLFVLACSPSWIFWLKEKYMKGNEKSWILFYVGAVLWILAVSTLIVQS